MEEIIAQIVPVAGALILAAVSAALGFAAGEAKVLKERLETNDKAWDDIFIPVLDRVINVLEDTAEDKSE